MFEKTTNEVFVSDWYIIPSRIRRLPGMTLPYLDIYESIFQFINKGKNCFLTNAALVERTGHSLSTVHRAITFFVKCNELKRVQVGFKYYIVVPERKIEIEPTNDQTLSSQMTGGGVTADTGGVSRLTPINKEAINKENITTTEPVVVDEKLAQLASQVGITSASLQRLVSDFGKDSVGLQLRHLVKQGNVSNPVGWLMKALKENFKEAPVRRIQSSNNASYKPIVNETRCTLTPEETDALLVKLDLPKTDPIVGKAQVKNLRRALGGRTS